MMAIIEANWPFLNVIIESPSVEALASIIIKGCMQARLLPLSSLPGELTGIYVAFFIDPYAVLLPSLSKNQSKIGSHLITNYLHYSKKRENVERYSFYIVFPQMSRF